MPEINYDRALETLQSSVCAGKGKARNLKKALGLKDLLIKVLVLSWRHLLSVSLSLTVPAHSAHHQVRATSQGSLRTHHDQR